MMRCALCACALLLALDAAGAAAVSGTGLGLSKRDANAPIAVSADHLDVDFNTKDGIYTGNVVVTQGDFRLRADKIRVNFIAGKPDKIIANGNVVIAAPSGNAQGDNGVYDVGPRLVTLTGRVILAKEKNVMRGSMLTVNLVTGQAQLGAKGTPGNRVQSLFTPTQQAPAPQSSPPPNTNP